MERDAKRMLLEYNKETKRLDDLYRCAAKQCGISECAFWMVFTSIYGVVDGLFVSNFAGKTPFAAINLVMPFIMVLGGIGFMIGTGGTALVSKVLGEGEPEKAKRYFNALHHHIIPKLGSVKLEKLTMLQIQQFYNELLKSGRVQKKNQPELKEHGLSPRMVQCVHVVLNKALEHAVEEKLILANPAKKCKIPKNTRKEMNILPEALIGPYLSAAKEHGILAPMYLELTTGLRRGELLALRWEDLDVQNRTLSINKSVARQDGKLVISTPKTPNSIRTVLLPTDTVKLLVEEHEKHPANPYLFPSPRTGETWDPDGFRRLHDRIIKEIGAEHVRFHDMRHTFATLSLKSGVDVRTLSETLGHFSAGFTLSTYVHSTPGMKQSAADAIGNTIRNAI